MVDTKYKKHDHIPVHPETFVQFRKLKYESGFETDNKFIQKLLELYSKWKKQHDAKVIAKEKEENYDLM